MLRVVKSKREVLYSTKAVRGAILSTLNNSADSRIVISAYVGEGADSLLPNAKGIELVCSPTPGGTNPNALRALMSKGLNIRLADQLHMKVYWSGSHGAVITSANLSLNALGRGGLKEIGIRLFTQEVDIQRILAGIKSRPVTDSELKRLDRAHRAYVARNGPVGRSRAITFEEWYDLPHRELWKMIIYDGIYDLSKRVLKVIEHEFGKQPYDGIHVARGEFKTQDWVLCAHISNRKITNLGWVFVDRVVPVPRRDPAWDASFAEEAFQVNKPKFYPPPPFKVDSEFRSDLNTVITDPDMKRLNSSAQPPPSLLKPLKNKHRASK